MTHLPRTHPHDHHHQLGGDLIAQSTTGHPTPPPPIQMPISYLRLLWRSRHTEGAAVARLQPSRCAHERPRSLRRENRSAGPTCTRSCSKARPNGDGHISKRHSDKREIASKDAPGRSLVASHLPGTFSDRTADALRVPQRRREPKCQLPPAARLGQRSEWLEFAAPKAR